MRLYLADLGRNLLTVSSDTYPLRVANLATYTKKYLDRGVLLATGLLIVLSRVIPLVHPHDPWFDEAMLIANLPLMGPSAFFHPLPLFEQAAPLGYLFLANTVTSLFPDALVLALRVLSAIASLLATGLIYVSLRRLAAGSTVSLALAFACLTPFTVIFSVEIKPYIFEYLASAVMLYLGVRLIEEYNKKNLAYFAAGGVFSIIFSFSAPIVIGAFGVGVIAQRWLPFSSEPKTRTQLGTIFVLTLLAITFLVYYFGYTRPVTELQFTAYADGYNSHLLTLPPHTLVELKLWHRFPNILIEQVDPFYGNDLARTLLPVWFLSGIKVLLPIFLILGIVTMARRCILLPVSFITATVLIYGLSLAGLLPIWKEPHFAFMVPITGTILGFGLFSGFRWLSRWAMPRQEQLMTSASCALVIVLLGAVSLVRSATLERQQVLPLIDYIISHGDVDTPVWVYYGAQPAMRVMAPNTLVQLGLVSHSSSRQGWLSENQNHCLTKESYFDDFRRTIHGLPHLWLIFSYLSAVERDDLQRYWAIAQEEVGGCRQVLIKIGAVLWKCN
jgi:hypothetical protein